MRDFPDEHVEEFNAVEAEVQAFVLALLDGGADPCIVSATLLRASAGVIFNTIDISPEDFVAGARQAFDAVRVGEADA